jgi:hypothetical protein
MTRSEQCRRCAWHSKIGGYLHAQAACAYADSSAGRQTVIKTVCDIYHIPYEEAARRVPEILEREGCPCFRPRQQGRRRS